VNFPRYYVAGPIAGYPEYNRPAFERAKLWLVERDPNATAVIPHEIPPAEHDGECPPSPVASTGEHAVPCYLRTDLQVLLESDHVYVLRGWEASNGARLEIQVAAACGIPLEFELYDEGTFDATAEEQA
jgi:hypothetical protein